MSLRSTTGVILIVLLVGACGSPKPSNAMAPTAPTILATPSPSAQPSAPAKAGDSNLEAQATCVSGPTTAGTIDYPAGAQGPKGAVLAVAAHQIKGLRPSDRVELLGTDAKGSVTVRVVRDGMLAAVGTYDSDASGGWLISTTMICSGIELRWGS